MYKRDVVNAYACASLLYVSPRHPLTVAYGRQRDARVAYVHNTVHRYRGGGCARQRPGGMCTCMHTRVARARVRWSCLRRCCVEDGATTRVADRNCEVEAMIEPVLQHIVYRGRRGRR